MITSSPSRVKNRQLAQSYATVGLETAVLSASPEKLVSLLFAGAINNVSKAKFFLESGNVAERGSCISKALDIITAGLRSSVDETQGEVAKNLVLSYELMAHHLLQANRHGDVTHLNTVLTMLNDIGSAWDVATNQAAA